MCWQSINRHLRQEAARLRGYDKIILQPKLIIFDKLKMTKNIKTELNHNKEAQDSKRLIVE